MARARHNVALTERCLRYVSDPILKIRILELHKQLFELNGSETSELDALTLIHGLNQVVVGTRGKPDAKEICGKPLSEIKSMDLKELMCALVDASDGVDKNVLCRRLWNLDYDPVIHDRKIYKVIYRARNYFGKKDLIENTYGGYRLSPKYLRK